MNSVGKPLNSVNQQNCTDQFTNSVQYVLLSAKKIIKFCWEFTKLYQFNVKQMEMCSIFQATRLDRPETDTQHNIHGYKTFLNNEFRCDGATQSCTQVQILGPTVTQPEPIR